MLLELTTAERTLALLALERRKIGEIYTGHDLRVRAARAIRDLRVTLSGESPYQVDDPDEQLQLHRALYWAAKAQWGWPGPTPEQGAIADSFNTLAALLDKAVPPVFP